MIILSHVWRVIKSRCRQLHVSDEWMHKVAHNCATRTPSHLFFWACFQVSRCTADQGWRLVYQKIQTTKNVPCFAPNCPHVTEVERPNWLMPRYTKCPTLWLKHWCAILLSDIFPFTSAVVRHSDHVYWRHTPPPFYYLYQRKDSQITYFVMPPPPIQFNIYWNWKPGCAGASVAMDLYIWQYLCLRMFWVSGVRHVLVRNPSSRILRAWRVVKCLLTVTINT